MLFSVGGRTFMTVVVICYASPWFLAVLPFLAVIYRKVQLFYLPSSRQLQRLESTRRSPVFSGFTEAIDGATSIRVTGLEGAFEAQFTKCCDANGRAFYLQQSVNRWLAVRLESVGTLMATSTGLFCVLQPSISAGVAGLALSYAISVTQGLNWLVRMGAELAQGLVAVERCIEYMEEPAEKLTSPVPEQWNSVTGGEIVFKDVNMRYREGLPYVLKGLSFRIAPGEHVGICGRTGAGKSSLLGCLLRLVDVQSGEVILDGVNVATIGAGLVRQRVSVIPQDTVVFEGSLRDNVDPLKTAPEGEVKSAVERAQLGDWVGLDEEVSKIASGGQKQLICLARAFLRNTPVVFLDEATSSVDGKTEAMIGEAIENDFKDKTVIAIAHRMQTLRRADRVMVMDAGKVGEFASPDTLMKQKTSLFKDLVNADLGKGKA
jgi:ABC-type multidrug transport system fused ATPase/permease subunit